MQTADRFGEFGQPGQRFPVGDQFHNGGDAIARGGNQAFAVRREGEAGNLAVRQPERRDDFAAGGRIPDANQAMIGAGRDPPAVGGKGERGGTAGSTVVDLQERGERSAIAGRPQAQEAVVGNGGEKGSVRTEFSPPNGIGMAVNHGHFRRRIGLEQVRGVIFATQAQFSVGTEVDVPHRASGAKFFRGGVGLIQIPQESIMVDAGQQVLQVGGDGEAPDGSLDREAGDRGQGMGVQDQDLAVISAHGEIAALRIEGEGADGIGEGVDLSNDLAGIRVGQADLAPGGAGREAPAVGRHGGNPDVSVQANRSGEPYSRIGRKPAHAVGPCGEDDAVPVRSEGGRGHETAGFDGNGACITRPEVHHAELRGGIGEEREIRLVACEFTG